MPTARNDGVELYYETEGSGTAVAFVGEAGYGAWQWGWQHRAVAGLRRALVYDHRGTGRSDAPDGPYSVRTLAADLEAVLAAAGADEAHLVGLGLGGMVALRYALAYGRARSLTLVGTAATGARVEREALAAMGDPGLEAVLSPAFRADQPEVVAGIADWRAGDAERAGFEAQVAAATGFDAADELYECTRPALVLHGSDDAVVPVDAGRDLSEGLPRGEFRAFEGAGHLVTVERSRPVNDALLAHLDAVETGT
jgi:pimeloyl-ACP methyl ester carboxylesterase